MFLLRLPTLHFGGGGWFFSRPPTLVLVGVQRSWHDSGIESDIGGPVRYQEEGESHV